MSNLYIVVSAKADFAGGNAPYSVYQWPGDAAKAAADATTNDRLPRKVYALELIGETESPVATYTDYRPKSVEAAG